MKLDIRFSEQCLPGGIQIGWFGVLSSPMILLYLEIL